MKNKGSIILIGILAVIAIVVFSFIGSYNGLVSNREQVEQALSNIDSQLQRRNDLIPNLVQTVKGYAKHEESIFSEVSQARSRLMGAQSIGEKSEADGELSSALNRLLAITESYPDLKANQNFINLQDELSGTENRIEVARNRYNEVATSYNIKVKKFPTNLVANLFNFESVENFKASEAAKEVPSVDFSS